MITVGSGLTSTHRWADSFPCEISEKELSSKRDQSNQSMPIGHKNKEYELREPCAFDYTHITDY